MPCSCSETACAALTWQGLYSEWLHNIRCPLIASRGFWLKQQLMQDHQLEHLDTAMIIWDHDKSAWLSSINRM